MGEKAPRRWYPCLMIIMCIRLVLQAAISFRAVPKAVHVMLSQFDAVKDQAIPTDKSITRWLTQIGFYKLNSPKEQATDWALIIDNSVQIGTQKCLIILGVRLSKFNKVLRFEDMDVLAIEVHNESDANAVCQSLERAQKKVGKVAMVCADDGPDLRGGVDLFCKKHGAGRIFDIIHKIGTFLKKILENDCAWKAFTSAAAEAKRKMQQTLAAHLVPPNQRTKSRFLNIEILVRWGVDVLEALETPNHPDKELLEKYCDWVLQHKNLIERLKQLDCISRETRQFVRENGLCSNSGKYLDVMLETVMKSFIFNLETCEYAGKLIDFVTEQSSIVPRGQIWIGSSEIIESLFGKLKSLEGDQSKGGFTSLVLGVAACVGKLDADVVMAAMSQVKIKDIDKWASEAIGTTLLSKRRKAFGVRRKKKHKRNIKRKLTGIPLDEVIGF
jgi:hypothetical protein